MTYDDYMALLERIEEEVQLLVSNAQDIQDKLQQMMAGKPFTDEE